MKEQIIDLLGKDHTTPIEFDLTNGFYGLYTYRGGVYVFKDGEDINYEDIDDKDKTKLLTVGDNGLTYQLDRSMQQDTYCKHADIKMVECNLELKKVIALGLARNQQ